MPSLMAGEVQLEKSHGIRSNSNIGGFRRPPRDPRVGVSGITHVTDTT